MRASGMREKAKYKWMERKIHLINHAMGVGTMCMREIGEIGSGKVKPKNVTRFLGETTCKYCIREAKNYVWAKDK